MLIPKEAVIFVREEEAIPVVEESLGAEAAGDAGEVARVPGVSILLKNNLCLALPLEYDAVKTGFRDGWLEIDEDEIQVVVNNINGTRDFISWLEYCLNQNLD
jgi:hypothetical protein